MPKYRVVISYVHNTEADSPEKAEEEAVRLFEEDMYKAASGGDNPADWMRVETTKIKN